MVLFSKMMKNFVILLCLHFAVVVLAYPYNVTNDVDDDYYDYFFDEDVEDVNERSTYRVKDGIKQKMCGDLYCRESTKKLVMHGKIPSHVFTTICESCFNMRTKQYENVVSNEKEITLFKKQPGGCYEASTVQVKDGCLCRDFS